MQRITKISYALIMQQFNLSVVKKKLSLAPTKTMLKNKKKKSGNIPLAPHFQKLVTDEEQVK